MTSLRLLCLVLVHLALAAAALRAQVVVLEVQPDSFDFGSVPMGAPCARTDISLRNVTARAIIVDSVWIVGPLPSPFALESPLLPDTVSSDSAEPYVVRFCPRDTSRQQVLLHLRFRSDGGAVGDTLIALAGQGSAGAAETVTHTLSPMRFDMPDTRIGAISPLVTDTMIYSGPAALNVSGAHLLSGRPELMVVAGYDTTRSMTGQLPLLGDFPFPTTVRPEGRFIIGMWYSPSAASPPCIDDTLVVETSLGAMYYPIRGCIATGRISVPATELNFGLVTVGASRELPLTVINEGNGVLSVDVVPIEPRSAPFVLLDTAGGSATLTSLALTIGGTSSRQIRYAFRPTTEGVVEAFDTIRHDGPEPPVVIRLRGIGVTQTATWSGPTLIDFGDVSLGEFRDSIVSIVNITGDMQTVGAIVIDEGAVDVGFDLVASSHVEGDSVAPGEAIAVRVRFTPLDLSLAQTALEVDPGTSRELGVQLRGRGRSPQVEELHARIDSASGVVGTPLELRVLVAPSLPAGRAIDSARIRLRMNPRSFHPLESPGWQMVSRARGDVTYERSGSAPIVGDVVGVVRVMPLSSAQPLDTIRLDAISLGSERVLVPSPTSPVALVGCDLGSSASLARSLKLRAITAVGGSSRAVLEYRAPRGAFPSVRVVDRAGALLGTHPLSEGTDETQLTEIDLSAYPPGMLLIELVVGEQRITAPIMHSR
jgi:hypothetical protein